MEHKANPGVTCGVCSCAYHDEHNHCTLDTIHVDPMPNADRGTAADESMCGSYHNRQR
ncbi:MAG: DUF1540 domain-containing protein [Oscillospiraceae bacterium]|jgi:hypothetical protein|nr:DUF1540 domain-containing protein [Oscillospiraceae bacterium]